MNNEPALTEYHVAIVGVGPKGLYGLELLIRKLSKYRPHKKVVIHLFNHSRFVGAGDVYRPTQPAYLKMNFADYRLNNITDYSPDCLWYKDLNFCDWLEENNYPGNQKGEHFSSRATVGKFLSHLFDELTNQFPDNVTSHTHCEEVVNIRKGKSFLQIITDTNSESKNPVCVNSLLLTTGHRGNRAVKENSRPPSSFIPFVYPVEKKLRGIEAESKVAVKGLGLTFIDAALALTEGRGGKFVTAGDDYKYVRSGEEPAVIYPFSRSGLPMIPRTAFGTDSLPLLFFTENRFLTDQKRSRPFHWEEELLPAVKKEFVYRYYHTLFKNYGKTLPPSSDFKTIKDEITSFHTEYSSVPGFRFSDLSDPFNTIQNKHQSVFNYLKELVKECSANNESPLLSAISAWHDISPIFNKIYQFGGLDAKSHQIFDQQYAGFFNRISYGPPLDNMKKIVALASEGIINFSYSESPKVSLLSKGPPFSLTVNNGNTNTIQADYFIDARIPKNSTGNNSHPLYRNMRNNQLTQMYENYTDGYTYRPGCVKIDKRGNLLSDTSSEIVMSAYGTPTEGLTFDNDTLSRTRNNFANNWALQTVSLIDKQSDITNEK